MWSHFICGVFFMFKRLYEVPSITTLVFKHAIMYNTQDNSCNIKFKFIQLLLHARINSWTWSCGKITNSTVIIEYLLWLIGIDYFAMDCYTYYKIVNKILVVFDQSINDPWIKIVTQPNKRNVYLAAPYKKYNSINTFILNTLYHW